MSRKTEHIGFLPGKIDPAISLHTVGMLRSAGLIITTFIAGLLQAAFAATATNFAPHLSGCMPLRCASLRARVTTQDFLSASPMNRIPFASSAHPDTLHKEAP